MERMFITWQPPKLSLDLSISRSLAILLSRSLAISLPKRSHRQRGTFWYPKQFESDKAMYQLREIKIELAGDELCKEAKTSTKQVTTGNKAKWLFSMMTKNFLDL